MARAFLPIFEVSLGEKAARLEVIAAVCHLGVPNSQILLNQIAASSCNLAILPKAPSELASAFFDNSAANPKKRHLDMLSL